MNEHPPIAEGTGYDQGNYYGRYLRHMEDAERQRLAKFEAKRRWDAAREAKDTAAVPACVRAFQAHLAAQCSHIDAAADELANAQAAGQVPPDKTVEQIAAERIALFTNSKDNEYRP